MSLRDIPRDCLVPHETRVRHTASGADGVFIDWSLTPNRVWVTPIGEEQPFEWHIDDVEVAE